MISPSGGKDLRSSINKSIPMSPPETLPNPLIRSNVFFSRHSQPSAIITDCTLFPLVSPSTSSESSLHLRNHTQGKHHSLLQRLSKCGPWTSSINIPGSLLETQIFRPHIRAVKSETLWVGPATSCFSKSSGWILTQAQV